jgi:glycosyltransferase involved in cell wall biosynthesis
MASCIDASHSVRERNNLDQEARRVASRVRVGIVCDLTEEQWPSMNLVADMLVQHLNTEQPAVDAVPLRPAATRRLTRLPLVGGSAASWRTDRMASRFWDYPRWLSMRRDAFDVFHVVDHSYAHLVHVLPADRTVVTCHDVDAFLSVVAPAQTTSRLPRRLSQRILSGFRKAGHVTCDSVATLEALRNFDLAPAERLTVVHNGVHPGFSPGRDEEADRAIDSLIGPPGDLHLLHVGSTIPRKRIDLLLHVSAAVLHEVPNATLLKAGGTFTSEQRRLISTLGIERRVHTVPFLDVRRLAALYRRADLVVLTSSSEGFGLPVIEAMACGTPVMATDLPVLREVGGRAAAYGPLGDVSRWTTTILDLLGEGRDPIRRANRRRACLDQAARFSWSRYAAAMSTIYECLSRERPGIAERVRSRLDAATVAS